MLITVSGMNAAIAPYRFDHLFGRYVYGFKPWTHCDHCLTATHAKVISPTMVDGSYELRDELFYLCGVGHRELKSTPPELMRRDTNIHLAVRPRKGSVAAIGSAYGVSFIIEGAQTIAIERPIVKLPDLKPEHSGCKMFQFGYQMFQVDEVDLVPSTPVLELRRRWLSRLEIPLAKPTR